MRAQRHANSYLLAPLRNRVRRDPGESDCGQHQAEHSNAAVCTDSEPRAGPSEIQVVAERSHIEDGQVRIDMSDLASNAAQRIRSRIHSWVRPRHNGHAIGWWPRKISPRQRYINYGLTNPHALPQVVRHADPFILQLVVPNVLPYRISISEKSSRGALVQYGRQRFRSVRLSSLIELHELSAGQHRLAKRGKIARAHCRLDCRYLNPRVFRSQLNGFIFFVFDR